MDRKFVSRFENLNTFSWFIMDALWMLGNHHLSIVMIVPTAVTALVLLKIECIREYKAINFILLMWIVMNSFWLLSEYYPHLNLLVYAKISFIFSLVAMIVATICFSSFLDRLGQFKRLRFRFKSVNIPKIDK